MIEYEVPAGERLIGTDDGVYWAVLEDLPDVYRDELRDALKADHLDYWEHPTDRPERTRTALDYDDSLTLLVGAEDDGIIGYDTSFPVTDDRLVEMYSDHIRDALASVTDETDAMLVYHMVLHPDYRGNGYGTKTAFIRQQLLEQDWDTSSADTPAAYYSALHDDRTPEGFIDAAAAITAADYPSPDAVISFPRLYETTVDRENGEESRAYRISQGFGFDDCGFLLNGGNDTFIIRTDPVSVDDRPVLLKDEL